MRLVLCSYCKARLRPLGLFNFLGTGLPAANNFNVGLIVTWPTFNGFATAHQVEEAYVDSLYAYSVSKATLDRVTGMSLQSVVGK
jgi:hypothetical protein